MADYNTFCIQAPHLPLVEKTDPIVNKIITYSSGLNQKDDESVLVWLMGMSPALQVFFCVVTKSFAKLYAIQTQMFGFL